MRPAVLLPLLAAFLLPGCAAGPDEIASISPGTPGYRMLPGRIALPQGSHFPTNCGPETLCGALNYLGISVPIADVERETYIPSIKGSVPPRIVEYARRKGASAKVTERGGLWKLQQHIEAGSPVIIEVTRGGQYHYYLVAGLNRDERVVVCAYYGDRQHLLTFEMLDELWKPTMYRSITFTVPQAEQIAKEGWEFLDAGRNEQSEERFLKALQVQPDEGLALAGLGKLRLLQGRLEEAQELLERAQGLWPGDPETLNNLANTLLKRKGDSARAAKLANEAVTGQFKRIRELTEELAAAPPGTRELVQKDLDRVRTDTFYYYGTLGEALENDGVWSGSIDARLESLKYPHLDEDDPDAPARRHLEIALTYQSMKSAKAAEHFDKAMELAKTGEFRERIKKAKN